MLRDFIKTFIFLTGLALLFPGPASAYIDPGVGSLILQGLAATAISVLVFWRDLRNRIKAFFTGRAGRAEPEKAAPAESGSAPPHRNGR